LFLKRSKKSSDETLSPVTVTDRAGIEIEFSMNKQITTIIPLVLIGFGSSLAAQTTIISEDFAGPAKHSNVGADGFLGAGGAGLDYTGQFGTWIYASTNSGIDEAGEGLEDGSGNGNQLSSIGLNRAQDFRGTNARANWVVFGSSNFVDGAEYTISFDVIGDPAGADTGRYWLAELYGYDASGVNFIQGDGTHNGWGAGAGTPKPWVASGAATVNFIEDSSANGVALPGATIGATGTVSFNFTYDGSNGADIGFAVGTYNNAFAIDNFEIVQLTAPPPETIINEEDFTSPTKISNDLTQGYLGTGGAGFDYNEQFGTWVYSSVNGGIDEAGAGLEDGSSGGNQLSSLGLNRPMDYRTTNGRANWVIFRSTEFTDGTEYTVSFDVIGDPAGADTGRYWLAELFGYDSSGVNFIQGQGAYPGWGAGAGTPKPWTANGAAAVNYIEDSATNGVPIPGETIAATTTVSFNFTYNGLDSPDIGFAVGTYNNAFAIDNFRIMETPAVPPVVPGPQDFSKPNFLIIIPDDHRWDAIGYIQAAITAGAIPGRPAAYARFPWHETPGLDSLADEGVLFQNAFATHSICSPARATMLTGLHAHKHGITDNKTPFPANLDTYASLLQENNYVTGYFGKWHMGEQVERPGFTEVATYINQGTYFNSVFLDENGVVIPGDGTRWVDDRTTDFAMEFIDDQVGDGQPFLAVVGFKTPHVPRTPPARHTTTYDNETLGDVPNLGKFGVAPLWDPAANRGRNITDNLNYMRTVAGIDDNVESLLARFEQEGWEDVRANTVVIYISDQGLFRNEHGQADKRAPYEESIRIPFIIRYPYLQTSQSDVVEIALNMDLAPTILDLAGVEIPAAMQGKSLKRLITNPDQAPTDWRKSFFFAYNYDQEYPYPAAPPEYIAIRNANGDKYVEYARDSAWNELFTGDDPYEIDNKINDPAYAPLLAELQAQLLMKVMEEGFLRIDAIENNSGLLSLEMAAGESFLFYLEQSDDLQNWTQVGAFEGSDALTRIDLLTEVPSVWDTIITSETADYGLAPGNIVTDEDSALISVGTEGGALRNAVLVFNLPAPPQPGALPGHAQLEVHANKKFAKFDIDLHALGYTASAAARIPEYHTSAPGPDVVKLQDTFLDENVPHSIGDDLYVFAPYTSNPNSALTSHLRAFYAANPNYTGDQYIHLRLNPNLPDPAGTGVFYRIKMANDDVNTSAPAPQLKLVWEDPSQPGPSQGKEFYRVRSGFR
jgi:arylsulfatase A-like enzyme